MILKASGTLMQRHASLPSRYAPLADRYATPVNFEEPLKPHLADTFKLSTDPLFVEKVYDVVGLYLNPPEAAVVLCVDEKSQVQALARSQPAFPMMPGMPEKRTHDYLRHGTTSLFAAFNTEDGTVISSLQRRHRAVEFKKFL